METHFCNKLCNDFSYNRYKTVLLVIRGKWRLT